jgi:hypothetical protein
MHRCCAKCLAYVSTLGEVSCMHVLHAHQGCTLRAYASGIGASCVRVKGVRMLREGVCASVVGEGDNTCVCHESGIKSSAKVSKSCNY